jgi:hypothetical protein
MLPPSRCPLPYFRRVMLTLQNGGATSWQSVKKERAKPKHETTHQPVASLVLGGQTAFFCSTPQPWHPVMCTLHKEQYPLPGIPNRYTVYNSIYILSSHLSIFFSFDADTLFPRTSERFYGVSEGNAGRLSRKGRRIAGAMPGERYGGLIAGPQTPCLGGNRQSGATPPKAL